MQQALTAQLPEPNAMTLATVGADGRPSTRVVLIKGFDARGIVWYTNYDSRKGRELAQQPQAALQFHWVELERVVRIEGRVEKTGRRRVRRLLRQSRPLDSRIGAWASPQSQVISSRACWWPRRRKLRGARSLLRRRGRRTGAATAWCPTAGSSGRAARAACTTACATGVAMAAAWVRERLAP
jgi:pyridoxamine 5'-phosphate oxidase